MVFQSATLLATGIYLLAIAGAGYYVRYFGGTWGKRSRSASFSRRSSFSAGSSRPARCAPSCESSSTRTSFPTGTTTAREWLRFTNLLSSRDPSVSTAQRSVEALANLVESPAGALWLLDDHGKYVQEARWNFPRVQVPEPAEGGFAGFMRRTGWVVNLAEYADEPSRYPSLRFRGGSTSCRRPGSSSRSLCRTT